MPPRDLNALPLPALYARLRDTGLVRRLLELARDEDLGPGDLTSALSLPEADRLDAAVVARAPGVVAGLAAVPDLLAVFGGDCRFIPRARDGDRVAAGDRLGTLAGPARAVLAVERTLLNLLGRLSGVATAAAAYVAVLDPGSTAKVLDTRKTTPGLRVLEKYAVRCGGGSCHRLGLHDAVLVKDNHLARVPLARLADWAADAARRARALATPPAFVEFEVDSLDQLGRLLRVEPGLIDIILLDNVSPPALARADALRRELNPAILLEASGGVTLGTIGSISRTGVDRISVGAITHSAAALDVALDVPAERSGA